jgi:hypothetical protein
MSRERHERARIDDYFAARGSPADERIMREHIGACEACRAYFDRRVILQELDPGAPSREARLLHGLGIAPAQDTLREGKELRRELIALLVARDLRLAVDLETMRQATGILVGRLDAQVPLVPTMSYTPTSAEPLLTPNDATLPPGKRRMAKVISGVSLKRSSSPLALSARTCVGSARKSERAALLQ